MEHNSKVRLTGPELLSERLERLRTPGALRAKAIHAAGFNWGFFSRGRTIACDLGKSLRSRCVGRGCKNNLVRYSLTNHVGIGLFSRSLLKLLFIVMYYSSQFHERWALETGILRLQMLETISMTVYKILFGQLHVRMTLTKSNLQTRSKFNKFKQLE